MRTLFSRLLNSVASVRSEETTPALLMFAYSFLAMTSYNIVKPITRAQFIEDLGADNLPYVLFAAGVSIGVIMHFYTNAVRRVPRQHVVPVTQAAIAVMLVVFWALLRTGAIWVTIAFYLFGLILGILLISQFWTLANDIFDARQAKRLFGFHRRRRQPRRRPRRRHHRAGRRGGRLRAAPAGEARRSSRRARASCSACSAATRSTTPRSKPTSAASGGRRRSGSSPSRGPCEFWP